MRKRRRVRRQVRAMNGGEFQLPEPILHRIQYFLTAKEAARTAILSKSWLSAWSTRPNLDLDLDVDDDDVFYTKFDEFSEVAKKTIQRYEQSNLKIESLKVRIVVNPDLDVDAEGLANDLITRALKIGAIHLNLQFTHLDDVPQVVFEAENLVELSVDGCRICDLDFGQKVRCSKLESLSLWTVMISSEMISNIASYCPLIWKLSLSDIIPFNFDGYDEDAYFSFLGDLSSVFPSLKDLTLDGCETHKVSSHSLEQLSIATGFLDSSFNAKFDVDVPSIRKFSFDGRDIPSLSLVSAQRECESHISITNDDGSLSTLWFRRLNKFLTESSLSKIYLSLTFINDERCEYVVGDIRGLTKPKVEILTIKMKCDKCPNALTCFALFHDLFQICRPKLITVDNMWYGGEIPSTGLLCKTLARGLDDKWMYGLHDLQEVNVHLFDKDVDAWRPLQLESFLDPSISPNGNQKTRFQLKWET